MMVSPRKLCDQGNIVTPYFVLNVYETSQGKWAELWDKSTKRRTRCLVDDVLPVKGTSVHREKLASGKYRLTDIANDSKHSDEQNH